MTTNSLSAKNLKSGDILFTFSRKRMAPRRLKVRRAYHSGNTVLVQFMGSEPSITLLAEQEVAGEFVR